MAIRGEVGQRLRWRRGGDPRLVVALLLSVALNAAAILVRLDAEGSPGARPPEHRHSAVLSTRTLSAPVHDAAVPAPIPAAEASPPSIQTPSVTTSVATASPPVEAGLSAAQSVSQAATETSSAASAVAAATAPPTAASPDYARTSELDTSPVPLADIVPDYPAGASSRRGHVVLELFISESGKVDRVDVLSATPPGVFDDSARTAFLQATFEPGRRRGIASRSRMTIEVDYRPADQTGPVSPTRY